MNLDFTEEQEMLRNSPRSMMSRIGCQDYVLRCQFDAIEMVKPEGSKKY
jgi:hypothetical protein